MWLLKASSGPIFTGGRREARLIWFEGEAVSSRALGVGRFADRDAISAGCEPALRCNAGGQALCDRFAAAFLEERQSDPFCRAVDGLRRQVLFVVLAMAGNGAALAAPVARTVRVRIVGAM